MHKADAWMLVMEMLGNCYHACMLTDFADRVRCMSWHSAVCIDAGSGNVG